jgi:uncharacterized protein
MILRFRFSNFRSFRREQELSLVASRRRKSTDGLVPIPHTKESALRVAGIYGANASGKTNVMQALQFLTAAVSHSHLTWSPASGVPVTPFRGAPENEPSGFVLDFLIDGVQHQYGFRATSRRIVEEWLERFPTGKPQQLYRRTDKTIRFGRNLRGENNTIAKLMRPNSLFLSTAAQNNHEVLGVVYRWFQEKLTCVFQKTALECSEAIGLCFNEVTREEVGKLIAAADFGVVAVEPDKTGTAYAPEKQAGVRVIHNLGGERVSFELGDESSGTIAFLALVGPMLRMLKNGGTLLVDELDSGLHPTMISYLLQCFADADSNPRGAQLIFNTHDATLLSSGLLERDQVWFTEKDRSGESRLYPLTDFKPRQDENFERGYLQGRYGAVPYLSAAAILDVVREK